MLQSSTRPSVLFVGTGEPPPGLLAAVALSGLTPQHPDVPIRVGGAQVWHHPGNHTDRVYPISRGEYPDLEAPCAREIATGWEIVLTGANPFGEGDPGVSLPWDA